MCGKDEWLYFCSIKRWRYHILYSTSQTSVCKHLNFLLKTDTECLVKTNTVCAVKTCCTVNSEEVRYKKFQLNILLLAVHMKGIISSILCNSALSFQFQRICIQLPSVSQWTWGWRGWSGLSSSSPSSPLSSRYRAKPTVYNIQSQLSQQQRHLHFEPPTFR